MCQAGGAGWWSASNGSCLRDICVRVRPLYHVILVVFTACGAGFGVWIRQVSYWFYDSGEAAPAICRVGAGTVVVALLAEVVDAPVLVCCDGAAALFPADDVCVETLVPVGACGVVVACVFAVWAVHNVVWATGILAAPWLVAFPFGTFVLEGMALYAPGLWESVLGIAGSAAPASG